MTSTPSPPPVPARAAQPLGSDFDAFLAEEGILEEAKTVAKRRVLAYRIAKAMEGSKKEV